MYEAEFKRATYIVSHEHGLPHVLIATITGRQYMNAFADSRQEAMVHALTRGFNVTSFNVACCLIDESRNLSIEEALKASCDFVLFLDDDMLLPSDLVPRLVGVSKEHDADVVGVLCTSRQRPARLIGFDTEGVQFTAEDARRYHADRMVVEAGGVGTGVMMVRTSIFERLEKPHFSFDGGHGEDFGFCKKVWLAGGKVVCDFGVESRHNGKVYPGIAHIGVYAYSLEDA
jgi:GT2 family glycosyltransferase